MKCPNCGKDVPEDARYCPYCGGRLQEVGVKSSHEVHTEPGRKDLLREELAELRHRELITTVFGVISAVVAGLSFGLMNLTILKTEWRCVVTLYGSCIWALPEFKTEQPYKDSGLIMGLLSIALAIIFFGMSIYYSEKRRQIINELKDSGTE